MKSILYALLLLGPLSVFACCPPVESSSTVPCVDTTHPDIDEVIEYVRIAIADSDMLGAGEKERFTELFDKALENTDQYSFLPIEESNELQTLVVNAGLHHIVRIGHHVTGCMATNRMVLHYLPLDEYDAIKLAVSCGEWGRMQKNGIIAAGIGYHLVSHPIPHREWVINVIEDKSVEVPEETGYATWGWVQFYHRTPSDLWGFKIECPMYEMIDLPSDPQEAS